MQLKPEQRKALELMSKTNGMSLSATVRWCLDRGFIDKGVLRYAGPEQEETNG